MTDLTDDDHPAADALHDVLVLYATETGTAQDAADRAARHLRKLRVRARVLSVDQYPLADLVHEPLVLFLVATAGSGAFPRPAHALWALLLRADLPPDLFDDLDFAVFGLGDSGYEKFCWPAKLLERRLQALGGRALVPRGEGDDQHPLGVDGALLPWLDALTGALLEFLPLPDGCPPPSPASTEDALPPPRVSFRPAPPDSPPPPDPRLADPRYHPATLRVNTRITADDWWQDVRHFEFDFAEDVRYAPGDVACILPQNPPDDVQTFLELMGWEDHADEPVSVHPTLGDQTLPPFLPPRTTLRALLTTHLSISAVPRRAFWECLRWFLQDEMEREKVGEFLSEEGADDLYAYTTRPRRTLLEVLAEFRSARGRVPREYALDLVPFMREREFSIASSVTRHPRQVHLCVAIVRYKTMLKVPRRGVATAYLAALQPGACARLIIGLKRGLLSLPPDPATPVICVGPGTGVAPMRAVVEERAAQGATGECADTTLYFGCRSASKDQHYAAEWAAHARAGALAYRLAASRDAPPGELEGGRTYVQTLLARDAPRVWARLRAGGCVFISGSSNKMPAAVRAALRSIAQTEGGLGEAEAREYVEGLERAGRLVEECWG
ncbi:riboflavin synthase domain-like protein [Gloeophyllum trabeum ATCC 11539]|uniref:NADPH-dependent diflavin oxidoreductase 1 n=1 Tax=Gloeophyllum trabeum (strain ATCC 11539 / FP-39264 / Madison 617) TaxID=670483 RepID=S7Q8A6_GLOTA|nr:riboflavin synthase domain-like protein [Gloeophyllum trabeum ATCC 11539]EPQ55673.1 riboflavin synthase domain-like protein [Gloeophyllum trabeum ATCC 11539]